MKLKQLSLGGLAKHKEVIHKGVIYHCDQCEYKASWPYSLIKHKQTIHEGVWYSCYKCEYQASWQSSLITHKHLIYVGVRYNCDHCEYKATQKSGLTKHKQSKHQLTCVLDRGERCLDQKPINTGWALGQ